jgi:mismatch-specific thymine-DNA glycosylase
MTEVLNPLPDIVRPNLKILFIGTNPGRRSAIIGHYFAGRGNAFWTMLYRSGLTNRLYTTEEDQLLLKLGYGLTDVIKRPSRSISEVKRKDAIGMKDRLDKTIKAASPRMDAFIGKTGYRYYLADFHRRLKYGMQEDLFGHKVFLLPSTSGASYADTKPAEKLLWFKKLKEVSSKFSSTRL